MKKKNIKNKGFTLIEMLVVVFIIALLTAVIVPGLSRFHNQQVLQNTTEEVVTLLNEARNNTISSKNSNTYGVHFQIDRVILFTGITFNSNDSSNVSVIFDTAAIIPAIGGISLNGGGNNIIFNRITGETVDYGTIIIRLASDATQQKSISINQIGVIGSN